RTSLGLSPDESDTHCGLGAAAHLRAVHALRTGADPAPAIDAARAELRRAVELDGRAPAIRVELGRLEMTAARRTAALGKDVRPALAAAKETLDQSRHVNATHAPTLAALAALHALRAEHARALHTEAEQEITEGLSAADAALAIYPKMALATAA